MELNEYQEAARRTAIYPQEYRITYPALGLTGEAGEVAEKVKKLLRDDSGELSEERRQNLIKEAGDVLWYLANLAADLDSDLETIARTNVEKLASRSQRGKLGGDGDNR